MGRPLAVPDRGRPSNPDVAARPLIPPVGAPAGEGEVDEAGVVLGLLAAEGLHDPVGEGLCGWGILRGRGLG